MRPGDLIFYGTVASDPGSVYHVAMYIGNGQVVEASRPDIPVRIAAVRWTSTMPFAGPERVRVRPASRVAPVVRVSADGGVDQLGEHDDVVVVVPGCPVEHPAAGDQP